MFPASTSCPDLMMGLVPALLLLTLDEVIGLDEVDVGVQEIEA